MVNANYNYNTDINMTTARANAIQGYPTTTSGGVTTPVAYGSIATDYAGSFAGIFYTDHATCNSLCSGYALLWGGDFAK